MHTLKLMPADIRGMEETRALAAMVLTLLTGIFEVPVPFKNLDIYSVWYSIVQISRSYDRPSSENYNYSTANTIASR